MRETATREQEGVVEAAYSQIYVGIGGMYSPNSLAGTHFPYLLALPPNPARINHSSCRIPQGTHLEGCTSQTKSPKHYYVVRAECRATF